MLSDYHQARSEPDRAWLFLQKVHLKQLGQAERDYFLLLRAYAEWDLKKKNLALKNLRELSRQSSDPLLSLRAELLKAELVPSEFSAELQSILATLPEHPFTEFFRWTFTARGAKLDKRDSEALQAWSRVIELARDLGSPRLRVIMMLEQARAGAQVDPSESLLVTERAIAELEGLMLDKESELFEVAKLLSRYDLELYSSATMLGLRGRLLDICGVGRTRWYMIGDGFALPGRFPRTQLLLEAISEAETRKDWRAAAWLCASATLRVFGPKGVGVRDSYYDRALAHLKKLGPTPYPEPRRAYFVSDRLLAGFSDQRSPSERPIDQGPRSADRLLGRLTNHVTDRNQQRFLGDMVEYFKLLPCVNSPRTLYRHFVSLLQIGHATNRRWRPDYISYGYLDSRSPDQELVLEALQKRPRVVARCLKFFGPDFGYEQLEARLSLLAALGRHGEARWMSRELEKHPQTLKFPHRARRTRIETIVSYARTKELSQCRPLLHKLYEELVEANETINFSYLTIQVPLCEALILTGQHQKAVHLLDKALRQIELGRMSDPSVQTPLYLLRAMAGRLAGEKLSTTLSFLERGQATISKAYPWEVEVYRRWRIALLLDAGRLDEAEKLIGFDTKESISREPGSRLQIRRRLALARGDDPTEAVSKQNAEWREYLQARPQLFQKTMAYRRVINEIGESTLPSVNETFVSSLQAAQAEPKRRVRRQMEADDFLAYLGSLSQSLEGDSSLLLPRDLSSLRRLQATLGKNDVLYHPILLPDRLVKLCIGPKRLEAEEFILNPDFLASQVVGLAEGCGDPQTPVSELNEILNPLTEVVWDEELNHASTVWLLLPKPFDSLPWPLVAKNGTQIRWTDGRINEGHVGELGRVALAGANGDLPGSLREMASLRSVFPQSEVWDPEAGFEGLLKLASRADVLHLSGHAESGGEASEGSVDLGPLKVGLDDLFRLRFRSRALVVIGTCDGGVSRPGKGGRSFSLATPLRAVGARAVLANLWTLDDENAANLFPKLYSDLKRGEPAWRALTKRRREARMKGEQPYYWAGLHLIESLPKRD